MIAVRLLKLKLNLKYLKKN